CKVAFVVPTINSDPSSSQWSTTVGSSVSETGQKIRSVMVKNTMISIVSKIYNNSFHFLLIVRFCLDIALTFLVLLNTLKHVSPYVGSQDRSGENYPPRISLRPCHRINPLSGYNSHDQALQ